MQLHNYNRTTASIRSILIVLLLIFICAPFLNKDIAEADIYVSTNFYYASGVITIGCVALYFVISSGNRGHFSKKEKPTGNSMIASMNDIDLELTSEHTDFDNPFYEGRLKIFTW